MKSLVFCTVILCFLSGRLSWAKVPASWMQGEDSSIHLFGKQIPGLDSVQVAADAEQSGMEQDLNRIYRTGDAILSFKSKENASQSKIRRPWYLQSMKTELGIEASGEIGLLGIEGEAAIELIWMRTASSIKKLQSELKPQPLEPIPTASSPNDSIASLSTSMTPEQVAQKVDDLVRSVGNGRKIDNPERLRHQLMQRTQELQGWVGQFEQFPDEAPWKPYKYQIELFIQADGMVVPAVEVGGLVRIRLEWTLTQKKKAKPSRQISTMLGALSEDLSALQDLNSDTNSYSLKALKIGLGIGASGDIGIAEGEGTLIGSVFLKPDPKYALIQSQKSFVGTQELTQPYGMPRDKFRQGILKATEMSRYIARTADRHEQVQDQKNSDRMFELGAIEIELALTLEGGTFLPSITKNAVMEIFLMKKSRQGLGGL